MARQTIQQDIKLVGGREVEAELKKLGAAGERAGRQLKTSLSGSFGAQFAASIAALRTRLVDVGRAGAELGAAFLLVGKRATLAAGAVTAVAGAATLFAKAGIDAADAVGKQAQKLGLSVKAYQELEFAAKKSDLSTEQFSTAISRLNKALAVTGSSAVAGGAVKVFKDLGITVTDASKMSEELRKKQEETNEALEDGDEVTGKATDALKKFGISGRDAREALLKLADAFQAMPDGVEKSAIALAVFGRSGAELIPLLNLGRAGIEAEGEAFHRLAGGITEDQTRIADAAGDAIDDFLVAVKGLRNQVGLAFAPALKAIAEGFSQLISENREALTAFATTLATETIPLVKDFVAALSGRDADVSRAWIISFRDGVVELAGHLATIISVAGTVLKAIQAFANGVAAAIKVVTLGFVDVNGATLLAIVTVGKFLGIFNLLGKTFGLVGAAIRVLVPSFTFAGVAVAGLGLAFRGLLAILLTIFTPGGLIAVGIGALVGLIIAFWPQISAAAEATWQALKDAAEATWNFISEGFLGIGSLLVSVWDGMAAAARDVWAEIKSDASDLWNHLQSGFDFVVGAIETAWAGLTDAISSAISSVISFLDDLISKAIAAANAIARALAARSSPSAAVTFARGGPVFGAGTGTSDSIMARLSNGEFVIRADAVRHWGLNFFRALNSLQNPFEGFSLGGLVDGGFSMPRFADGGLAAAGGGSTGKTVRLELSLGGETFVMSAPEKTAENLIRFATDKQMVSLGKSSWWRGR